MFPLIGNLIIGVAPVPKDGIKFEKLYKIADDALYIVKMQSKNGFETAKIEDSKKNYSLVYE